jgi:arylsulfatase A-like enzyme
MRPHPLLCATATLLAACSAGGPAIEGGRTNVLLVVIDTLRADHLGCYGYPHDTSPTIDALAKGGVQLDAFYSTSSWTRPGMATLFTGHYPRTVGIYQERYDKLPPSATTLAERLQERGYRTLGITSNPNLNEVFGFAQGFDAHLDAGVVWKWMEPGEENAVMKYREDNLDDARTVTDRALAALDRDAARAQPFYLRVVYIDPHVPYAPPTHHQRAVAKTGSSFQGYDGEIRFADAQLGRLLDGLDERGLLADTLVIVTSDHGEGLASHPNVPGADGHGTTLYDSTTHIPLVLAHPALPAGFRISSLASSIHLVPTVMDLLGWPVVDGGLPGRSLAPLVAGEVRDFDGDPRGQWSALPDAVFSETEWRRNRKVAVRTREARLVRNDDCRAYQEDGIHKGPRLSDEQRAALTRVPALELYAGGGPEDLPANRATGQPVAAARLEGLLQEWEQETARAAPLNRSSTDVLTLGDGRVVPTGSGGADGSEVELDPATLERLRTLGYIE